MTQNSISRKKIIECKLTWFECYYLVILPQDLWLSQFEFPLKQLHLNLYSCIFDFHSMSFFWNFVPMIHQCQNGLILDYYCCYYGLHSGLKINLTGKIFWAKYLDFNFTVNYRTHTLPISIRWKKVVKQIFNFTNFAFYINFTQNVDFTKFSDFQPSTVYWKMMYYYLSLGSYYQLFLKNWLFVNCLIESFLVLDLNQMWNCCCCQLACQ